jgi:transcription-repair coupling factor (superfamily II helicase)
MESPVTGGTDINLHAPALLPADYLPDVHMRLVHYKRIAGTRRREELDDLMAETYDRFGPLPDAAKLLFELGGLRLRATPLGMRKIEAGPKGARIEFVEKPSVDPADIIRLLQSHPRLYRLDGPNRLRIMADMPDVESRIAALQTLLDLLAAR